MRPNLTRRDFLGAAGGLAAGFGAITHPLRAWEAGGSGMLRLCKVYVAGPMPTWPTPAHDITAEIDRIEAGLAEVANRWPHVRLDGSVLCRVPSDAPASAEEWNNPAGLLVFRLSQTPKELERRLLGLALPALIFPPSSDVLVHCRALARNDPAGVMHDIGMRLGWAIVDDR